MNDKVKQFENLTYEDFRKMAIDPNLSAHEKIGFPDSYRADKEKYIFDDIVKKLPELNEKNKLILDIGPGCGALSYLLIEECEKNSHKLVFVDSDEVLKQHSDTEFLEKIPAYYPDCPSLFEKYEGQFDCIINYSVFHYIFVESNVWNFLDKSLSLLAPKGRMLIGDIPNISKRKRFFSSDTGKQFHRNYTGKDEDPVLDYNQLETEVIDDSVIAALISRARFQGFDAYVLPQDEKLPMSNRREDILIIRP